MREREKYVFVKEREGGAREEGFASLAGNKGGGRETQELFNLDLLSVSLSLSPPSLCPHSECNCRMHKERGIGERGIGRTREERRWRGEEEER